MASSSRRSSSSSGHQPGRASRTSACSMREVIGRWPPPCEAHDGAAQGRKEKRALKLLKAKLEPTSAAKREKMSSRRKQDEANAARGYFTCGDVSRGAESAAVVLCIVCSPPRHFFPRPLWLCARCAAAPPPHVCVPTARREGPARDAHSTAARRSTQPSRPTKWPQTRPFWRDFLSNSRRKIQTEATQLARIHNCRTGTYEFTPRIQLSRHVTSPAHSRPQHRSVTAITPGPPLTQSPQHTILQNTYAPRPSRPRLLPSLRYTQHYARLVPLLISSSLVRPIPRRGPCGASSGRARRRGLEAVRVLLCSGLICGHRSKGMREKEGRYALIQSEWVRTSSGTWIES